MLLKTELLILSYLFEDLSKDYTIREISLNLNLPYPQIHRAISRLITQKILRKVIKGKSSIISLCLDEEISDYINVENERRKIILTKYAVLKILVEDLLKIDSYQFVCVLFGSYAQKRANSNSDIDLLFIIPSNYDYSLFEKNIKRRITVPHADIQITTEQGLLQMWNNPSRINIGNELLKKHIILYGIEPFLRLRRNWYRGT